MIMARMNGLGILLLCSVFILSFLSHCLQGCPIHELKALLSIRDSLVDVFGELKSWEGDDCCTWRGVHCDEVEMGRPVSKLDIHGFYLTGNMNSSLLELKHLKHLDLGGNNINWENLMPAGLGSLTNLTYLDMQRYPYSRSCTQISRCARDTSSLEEENGYLNGASIRWLATLKSLKYLALNRLQLQASEISPGIGNLSQLNHLELSGCGLQGSTVLNSLLNLSSLGFLDLSSNALNGSIPPGLGDLHFLTHLDLSYNKLSGQIPLSVGGSIRWLATLKSLKYLALNRLQLQASEISPSIGNLSQLNHLELSGCGLQGSTLLNSLLNLSSLGFLGLRGNNISGSIPSSIGNMSKLTSLDLSSNALNGSIPPGLADLHFLTHLDLSSNGIVGSIAKTVANLTNLKYLDLSLNILSGNIPSLSHMHAHSGSLSFLDLSYNELEGAILPSLGFHMNLSYIDLSYNKLSGQIPPSVGNLSALVRLELQDNHLNGSLPLSFSQLSSLTYLDVSNNVLNASVHPSEVLFQNTFKLEKLCLSDSGLSINFSWTWIPPFQLYELSLRSCKIGGPVPSWISTQYVLEKLDLSNTSIVGSLPPWLWGFSSELTSLYLPYNHLEGPFSPTLVRLNLLDLSKNELSGHLAADIDEHVLSVYTLSLADNKFEGKIPASLGNISSLYFLDLSGNLLTGSVPASLGGLLNLRMLNSENNHLDGEIPGNLGSLSQIVIFNIANNHLKGKIPNELGNMTQLSSLRIQMNKIQGLLPLSFTKLSELKVLDVGENNLTGDIPDWIANLSSLQVLGMRYNKFSGELPPRIGKMPRIQIIDLSSNLLYGEIPESYFKFSAMNNVQQKDFQIVGGDSYYWGDSYYKDDLYVSIKGKKRHFEYIISSFTCIDLSHNRLRGHLPPGIGNLKGLMFLKLSMNTLSGPIPDTMGNLRQLESLDLSVNNFSGQIPFQIGFLDYLGYLNLSYNNLSGRIPLEGPHMVTFENSSFLGNPNLWGCPLERKCSHPLPKLYPPPIMNVKETEEAFPWYEMSVGLSVGMGFSTVVMVLALKVRWRIKCFELMDSAVAFLFAKLFNWRR